MEQTLMMTKKVLTKLRLINWYTFIDETIPFKGSTLISGENTQGKTTILDAIQMALTADTHRFNQAANEKSNRSLIGYVRCKLGDDERSFGRTGVVVSHVALEFYEEDKQKYFTIGVVLVSENSDSPVIPKWYRTECSLDLINFVEDGIPTLPRNLRQKGSPVLLLDRNAYKEQILIRFGRLENRFFDLIRNSIAFKPMKNVREFINNFLLPEKNVNVRNLRENIADVKEFKKLYDECQRQKDQLDKILLKYDEYQNKAYDVTIVEILIALAECDSIKKAIDSGKTQVNKNKKIIDEKSELATVSLNKLESLQEDLANLRSDRLDNKFGIIAEKARQAILQLETDQRRENGNKKKLDDALENLCNYRQIVSEYGENSFEEEIIEKLSQPIDQNNKHTLLEKLQIYEKENGSLWNEKLYQASEKLRKKREELKSLYKTKENLDLKKFDYPKQSIALKQRIEEEFKIRNLNSKVYILCDLLELNDESWRNAVEGVLGNYRFFILVEPKYFNIALDVLKKSSIHTYGLINSQDLAKNEYLTMANTLASFVSSEDDIANKFIASLLGQINCCSTIEEMLFQNCAITKECFLYKNFVVEEINPDIYAEPFIGKHAFEIQLQKVIEKIEKAEELEGIYKTETEKWEKIEGKHKCINLETIQNFMGAPAKLKEIGDEIERKQAEEQEAINNPDLIKLNEKIDALAEIVNEQSKLCRKLNDELLNLKVQVKADKGRIESLGTLFKQKYDECNAKSFENPAAFSDAEKKFKENLSLKESSKIAENFKPMLSKLIISKETSFDDLKNLQSKYINQFECDLLLGTKDISRYAEIQRKLETVDIVERKNRLDYKKKECDDIFKNDFVSKIGDAIREAKNQFKKLNEKLRTLSYGEDTYEFTMSYDRAKEHLYRMFMDENNLGDNPLLAEEFNERYKTELSELYDKIIANNDEKNKVVQEYSDYRSYLDFDINILKNDGRKQRYSKVLGEKSGSETQVPFYVAIAASFYILYDYSSSIRLILFDEAFEKMDDLRIVTTMQFYRKLGLQTILVTPPAKIDTIEGEVDSVIIAIREGNHSSVVEYSHAKENT